MQRTFAMLAGASLLLTASNAPAAFTDHLQCFKIKEKAAKAVYTADLTPNDLAFDVAEGCVIKVPAKWLCLNAQPSNVAPAEPTPYVSQDASQTYLCYQTTCPGDHVTTTYTDSFGEHEITAIKTGMVCKPVVQTEPTPTCGDGIHNNDESDVDCGGSCPENCDVGDSCGNNDDCTTGLCDGGSCAIVAASCSNSMKDVDETDVDCGGPFCAPCAPGKLCGKPDDCSSMQCHLGLCADPGHCSNSVKDVDEGDVDCGGEICSRCDTGDTCGMDRDCADYICDGGVCAEPSCSDHRPNQDETGVDCGGSVCAACPLHQPCLGATDCASGYCSADSRCELATCHNGVPDVDETDTDCGGGDCEPCNEGDACEIPSDCRTNACESGTCIAPACTDPGQMCGGECMPCAPGGQCNQPADCMTGMCMDGMCM